MCGINGLFLKTKDKQAPVILSEMNNSIISTLKYLNCGFLEIKFGI